jgi:hypothetical protein
MPMLILFSPLNQVYELEYGGGGREGGVLDN